MPQTQIISAYHVEVDYGLNISGKEAVVGLTYQNTKEAKDFDLAEARTAAVFGVNIVENTAFTVEAGKEEDYAGDDSSYVVAKLSIEF